ncbi:MAG TPA: hypothetical protein VJ047_18490 [Pseudomonas sp.]|nr:hypothetical protein [Pseudomonas sp.]
MSLILLGGCAASVKSQAVRGVELRKYNKVFVTTLTTGSGSQTVTKAGLGAGGVVGSALLAGGLAVNHVMTGTDQVIMAGQDVEYALRDIGFETVSSAEQADAVAVFSIATVRKDPIAGWIADRAMLQFRDVKTGSVLYTAKSESSWVTLQIDNLIGGLKKEIQKAY